MFFFLFLEFSPLNTKSKSANRMDITPRKTIERHLRSLPLIGLDLGLMLASENSRRINNEDKFEIEHSFAFENNFIG